MMLGEQDKQEPLWKAGRNAMVWNWLGCLGDSITFGARSGLGYPEYLSQVLRSKTGMLWPTVNLGVNGETTLQIMRRADHQLREFSDVDIWCLCAGMNDCRVGTPMPLFLETYRQLLEKFKVTGKRLFVGTMPKIVAGRGHLPYSKKSQEVWVEANEGIRKLVKEMGFPLVELAEAEALGPVEMADSVHPNDGGCYALAQLFADAILTEAA